MLALCLSGSNRGLPRCWRRFAAGMTILTSETGVPGARNRVKVSHMQVAVLLHTSSRPTAGASIHSRSFDGRACVQSDTASSSATVRQGRDQLRDVLLHEMRREGVPDGMRWLRHMGKVPAVLIHSPLPVGNWPGGHAARKRPVFHRSRPLRGCEAVEK